MPETRKHRAAVQQQPHRFERRATQMSRDLDSHTQYKQLCNTSCHKLKLQASAVPVFSCPAPLRLRQ